MTIQSPIEERLYTNFQCVEDSLKSLQIKMGNIKDDLVKLQHYEKASEIRELEKKLEEITSRLSKLNNRNPIK